MKILALDVSSARTGAAVGDATAPPRTFSRKFDGGRGKVGAEFARWLRDLMMLENPDLVAFEAPLIAGRQNNAATARMLIGLALSVETACYIKSTHCIEANIQAWRKVFLGTGRPDDPKRAALEMCKSIGLDVGGEHDRADAVGVWSWAHFNHGNRRGVMNMLSGAFRLRA